jgi:hypothetical protein
LASEVYSRLLERVGTAHRSFQVAALTKLYPTLKGEELARAVARETMRDQQYRDNMRQRLIRGVTLIEQDPTLTEQERNDKLRRLEKLERRYLEMHVQTASWRMDREAEMSRLKRLNESGAYWLLDHGLKTHTPDCLAMEGRVWNWSVLEKINPANRHPGCGCRLIPITEARRRGLAIRQGYRTPAMRTATSLVEARDLNVIPRNMVPVPIRPGVPMEHVRAYTRVTKYGVEHVQNYTRRGSIPVQGVESGFPPELEYDLMKYLDAVDQGDLDKMDAQMGLLRKEALLLGDPDPTIRALTRIHAAAINPAGVRTKTGSKAKIGDESRPIPRPIPECKGIT